MESNKKVILLFSGGQDSATCLFWAMAKYGAENIVPINFYYGQKHYKESDFAHEILAQFNLQMFTIDVKGCVSGSALTDFGQSTAGKHLIDPNLPATFTAGRNALFLTVAASYGYNLGISDIITGVCQTDYSGYPDCRKTFIDAQSVALSLALNKDIQIHAPLMFLTKAETWKLASDLGKQLGIDCVEIIRTKTLTDYNGDTTMNEWGMGVENNPASILRAKGYREAKQNGWI
jgi:7-cyano-7-deazaguanine synthase